MIYSTIKFPVRLAANKNVPGVFYVFDEKDQEVCVMYNVTEEVGTVVVDALNRSSSFSAVQGASLHALEAAE